MNVKFSTSTRFYSPYLQLNYCTRKKENKKSALQAQNLHENLIKISLTELITMHLASSSSSSYI